MDKIFIGKHNSRLTDIRRAVRSGQLTSEGLLPVEGLKLLREARGAGLPIESLFVSEGTELPELPEDVPVYTVPAVVFKGIQTTEHSQGILGLVHPAAWSVEDIVSRSPAPIVVLARLQDPGNVGTILRVSEAFEAAGCIALPGTAGNFNPKVVRASAGSIFRVPHCWDFQTEAVFDVLKGHRVPIIGTSPHAERTITSWDWSQPAALLIGNEGSGLNDQELRGCDVQLRIPQHRVLESLNSAIATSIMLYEAYRWRNP